MPENSKTTMARKPVVEKRTSPKQDRSNKTINLILNAASEMLIEVGFEKLSTNVICERAGLTPPALYRYFPNKYAVLKELGERLMDHQNNALKDWLDVEINKDNVEDRMRELIQVTLDATREVPAGEWIMRSLHATPFLADVRLESHRLVSQILLGRVLELNPEIETKYAYNQVRLCVEISYSVVEMVFDDDQLDPDFIVSATAKLIGSNVRNVIWGHDK